MERAAIAGLVEKCLTAKQCDARVDTTALEQEIDQQVYALYLPAPRLRQAGGLTPEGTCPRIGRRVQVVEASSH